MSEEELVQRIPSAPATPEQPQPPSLDDSFQNIGADLDALKIATDELRERDNELLVARTALETERCRNQDLIQNDIQQLNATIERCVAERTAMLQRANDQKDELLAQERTARHEAELAHQRAAFLADASKTLSASLDYATILARLTHLALPRLGTWCIAFLVDDRTLQRAAAAHVDPALERRLQALLRLYPIDLNSVGTAGTALGARRSLLNHRIDESTVFKVSQGLRCDEVAREFGMDTCMEVPLIARGATLGQIAFGRAARDGPYTEADRALAEELGHRAALATDGASLFHQAKNAIQSNDTFVSSISHDLRGPLTNIKGYAQLLRHLLSGTDRPNSADLLKGLDMINASSTKMARMVDEILDVARLHMGQPLQINQRPMDLVSVVREVISEYEQTAHGHTILLEAKVRRLVGSWDEPRLERVIGNLISNALKYSPNGGEILIRIETNRRSIPPSAVVSVRDRGLGIPTSDLPLIFERFHRGTNVVKLVDGSGIGLSSSRQIVQQLGGSIAVESEEGKGSTFTVRLPILTEE